MKDDPLTQIVRSLDLMGAVFLDAEFSAPWAITAHVTEEDCRPYMPLPKQVIAYHVVTEGEALVSMAGGAHCWAKVGDVVLIPSNKPHVLASAASLAPVSGDDLVLPHSANGLARIRHGGGGAQTRILCGFLASRSPPSPLIETLPALLVISLENVAALRWIEASIAIAARELAAGRIACPGMMSALSELLVIEALRAYLERSAAPEEWLSGMTDQRIARALARIHGGLDTPPAVAELADAAGMSRSAFVDQFAGLLGVAPGRYVLDQRITAARRMLRDTTLSLAEIASRVGYDATESFARAFKRETGRTPMEWRGENAV